METIDNLAQRYQKLFTASLTGSTSLQSANFLGDCS